MRTRKKNLAPKFKDDEEAEKKFSDLSEQAENGDAKALMRILAQAGRGYDMSDDELEDFLKDFT